MGNSTKAAFKNAVLISISNTMFVEREDLWAFNPVCESLVGLGIATYLFYKHIELLKSSGDKMIIKVFEELPLGLLLLSFSRFESLVLAPWILSGAINDNVKKLNKHSSLKASVVQADLEGDFKKDVVFPWAMAGIFSWSFTGFFPTLKFFINVLSDWALYLFDNIAKNK
jgi:hypothetical protein